MSTKGERRALRGVRIKKRGEGGYWGHVGGGLGGSDETDKGGPSIIKTRGVLGLEEVRGEGEKLRGEGSDWTRIGHAELLLGRL